MSEDNTCPKFTKCPIFQGGSSATPQSEEVYRQLFCNAGPDKYKSCKRFMVSEATGKPVPRNIMPNSFLSVDDIVNVMKLNGLLD
ncbi:MAG: hypothetical protein JXR36_03685 [Bacteroidales bacterium]|nr:hypothetical protein [Bacteroidales bacterium]